MVNFKATVRHESPLEGRKFEGKEEKLSWGWKEFARKDRICESNRGYIFDMNKILIELEIKNVRIFYEEEIQLPLINPSNPFIIMESNQFSLGGFAWRLVISPNGRDEETRGQILVRLQVMIELF